MAATDPQPNAPAYEISLASNMPAAQVRWLSLDNGKFLALQREYLAATERGVAILVPELDNLPTSNNGIEQLRLGLNDHGWTTIAIMPPSRSTSKTTDDQANSYHKRLSQRLKSAITASKEIHQRVIVIAQGSQVSYLIKTYLEQKKKQEQDKEKEKEKEKEQELPIALIMLNGKALTMPPKLPDDQQAYASNYQQLSSQVSDLELKLLDLYYRQDHLGQQMLYRKKLSTKKNQSAYRQMELADPYTDHLVKSVYGWLKSVGLN